MSKRVLGRVSTAMVAALAAVLASVAGPAAATPNGAPATLPAFIPYQSNWSPNYTVFPYNLWQNRVTPEQITAQRDSCQWFNAQYDTLMSQVFGFQRFLGDQDDEWTAPGVQPAGDIVIANLDQSAGFLDPRAHTLYITNYPDQSQYSPLYNGDSIYRLWYQFTQISDKMKQKLPSGVINANIATANVYGTVIRDSGVCAGA
ncbi:hypothetical protein H7J87_01435 [Mycolicibacterium wolinskyi]|uniref:PknH-like extracellular domain-containing protein n=2 Tax=Mycobacteriaceae TaxID=1762 RepID=A0A1X2ER52_9MYCO|nr:MULTISPECIES: hypothetical protein [Mycolicibacterium]MCV7283983.1 hypothetical protein [Mycolicibacterium wolinskyi]MCV7296139.1 hypothetical protein [Mycolicibacterium goodii]ORX08730.1 hypothetical protein AWC31_11395 [Mycolicibacterium wolinskyi]